MTEPNDLHVAPPLGVVHAWLIRLTDHIFFFFFWYRAGLLSRVVSHGRCVSACPLASLLALRAYGVGGWGLGLLGLEAVLEGLQADSRSGVRC